MTVPKQLPTKEYLEECFILKDGVLVWKERPLSHFKSEYDRAAWCSRQVGKTAGTLDPHGYRQVTLNKQIYRVHRLVFVMLHGSEPKGVIDHCYGNRDNNLEIRDSTQSINRQNLRKASSRSTSGLLGAFLEKRTGKYYSQIKYGGKIHCLGTFHTKEEAHEAYLSSKRLNHVGCTI